MDLGTTLNESSFGAFLPITVQGPRLFVHRLAKVAVPQTTNDGTVSRAADANSNDDESDVCEAAQSEDESDTEHAAEDENVDSEVHHSTDDRNSSDGMPEAIDDGKFTDTDHHEEVEVGNTGYAENGASVDDDVKKDTAQSSDEDELGFELVDIEEV